MEIKYLGDQSIFIKGKKENILVNPSAEVLNSKKLTGRIIAFTNKENDSLGLDKERVILRGPGEYEIGGVEILGINAGSGKTVYIVSIDGVNLFVTDELKEELSEKKIEKINAVDVMMISIKENTGVGHKQIIELAKKLGANYLVPIDFKWKDEVITKFLDTVDSEVSEPLDALKIDKKEDLPEGKEVVVLKAA
ncbi:MAG TPA: MBL fold metallo-hydrolase [Patescibacteria group bacterium]